ncbi:MAG: hypothetical protein ACYS18_12435, partial [Planctomycetota bacterium]
MEPITATIHPLTCRRAVAETIVTVKADERVEPKLVLNAGVLAITAPGGDRFEIFGVEKDIKGKQEGFGYKYGEAWQV